jgi:pimeloyl-ACP methyl ester carboxylesterase
MTEQTAKTFSRAGKPDLAWLSREGNTSAPGFLWLGGYASDMRGSKASFIDAWCAEHNRAYLRFDYSGHGESGGDFEEGCISDWAADALATLDALTEGPQVLIGSSMGGWIACLLARWRPERLAGLVFIAPAPDFTSELMWPGWDKATQDKAMAEGKVEFPSEYDDSVMVYTRKLIEDGPNNSVFAEPLRVTVPVRILQGMQDDAVPWQHAMRFADHIEAEDVVATLVKHADHRMSGEEDLQRLATVLGAF